MHPAVSIILFTALSGLGFGLMVFLGIDPPAKGGWVMAVFAALALGLSTVGLLASTLHLGHPERAVKAFSQWRSSWLSREGVVAVATLVTFGLYATLIVLFGVTVPLLGWLSAVLALITVYCTAMIYTQLKTVPRWRQPLTPVLFLLFALTGGALLSGHVTLSLWLLAALGIAQVAAWVQGDKALAASGSTMESATGLGPLGKVRLLEPPHTGSNYLMREMIHKIGRKHSQKLRIIALVLMVGLPLLLGLTVEVKHLAAAVIVLSHVAGLFVARWLFFAEAEHVVGLYYGARG
ncbi:dimethyl sulfoxide reductase anchor subunit family protein [Oceanibium sediminis]|uniref:dimethyl sulfoxide reductase anchor subunit family protein n=1 Tax=Oceanibium sediminis TaxID=2026339 RepID=UPI000DD3EE35|nr:DmsC/YnfH family molybdoenzyme membrane anchor subunit [Oceanibium sediminis]